MGQSNLFIPLAIVVGAIPLILQLRKGNLLDVATLTIMLAAVAVFIGILIPDQVRGSGTRRTDCSPGHEVYLLRQLDPVRCHP